MAWLLSIDPLAIVVSVQKPRESVVAGLAEDVIGSHTWKKRARVTSGTKEVDEAHSVVARDEGAGVGSHSVRRHGIKWNSGTLTLL
mmetsp:Transcript_1942/g.6976  ORF Transcript_1942/g.6976 Transcript_1942/m.6976 type:complete len:86 (+) Transcript_1942:1169-1426(+)